MTIKQLRKLLELFQSRLIAEEIHLLHDIHQVAYSHGRNPHGACYPRYVINSTRYIPYHIVQPLIVNCP